jgi:phosphatidate cytidylyltransferase
MLPQRIATAAVGIPLVVLAIWIGDALLAGVIAVAVFVATLELAAGRGVSRRPEVLLTALSAALLPPAALAGYDYLIGAITLTILVATSALARTPDPRRGVDVWSWSLAPALYIAVLACHFILLREAPNGRDWVFFGVLTVWIADTGAYAVGRSFGSRAHKLAPAISPGKTIEGALGGAVAGFIAVVVLEIAFGLDLRLVDVIALGLILPQAALIGDLAESALKRSMGVKDSSDLFPGHGGVADRLDSLLFAAPILFYYLRFVL